MANEVSIMPTLTREVAFNASPVNPEGLFAVRAGAPADDALAAAGILLTFVRERNISIVNDGPETDEAWVHALLLDMVKALYKSAGAEA